MISRETSNPHSQVQFARYSVWIIWLDANGIHDSQVMLVHSSVMRIRFISHDLDDETFNLDSRDSKTM